MGASKFAWTDGGAQSFTTDLHVQRVSLDSHETVFAAESIDGSVVEAITVGSKLNEVVVYIEAERDADGLRDWLNALRRRLAQTMTPDVDVPATTFPATAVGVVPRAELQDEGAQSPLYGAGPIRLRRLDGGAFEI